MIGKSARILKKMYIMPQSFIGFLTREYKLLFRKKKYLYLSMALPVILGLIYIFMLGGSATSIPVIVCDYDNTSATRNILGSIGDFDIVYGSGDNCTYELQESLRRREFLFGIVIGKGFTERLDNLQQANIDVYYDNSEPSVSSLVEWKFDLALQPFKNALVYAVGNEIKQQSGDAKEKTGIALEVAEHVGGFSNLKIKLSEVDEELGRMENIDPAYLSNPVSVGKKGIYEEFSIKEVGIAPLFAVLNLFLILMLCSTGVIYDRKTQLFARIRVSNSSFATYILSKAVFFSFISVVQFAVLFLLFSVFGAGYNLSFVLLVKALLFISLVNTFAGILIGLASDSEGVAVLISLIITLPLLFLSGMFYPVDLMPFLVKMISDVMLLNTEILMMKQALLFGGVIAMEYFLIPFALFLASVYFVGKNR